MLNKNQLPPSESHIETDNPPRPLGISNLGIFRLPMLGGALDTPLPPYWSEERDAVLLNTYNGNNFVSSGVQTIVKIVCALPIVATADDMDDDEQVLSAEIAQAIFDAWWIHINTQAVTSLLVQDNGMFIELTGAGDADQPIEPTPIEGTNQDTFVTGMRFLEAARCTRTGIEETPVRYTREDDGKEILFHKSRVIFFADGESMITTLYGVGLCGLSRFFEFAKNGHYTITLDNESLSGNATSIVVGRNWPNPKRENGEGTVMEDALQKAYMRNKEKGRQIYQDPILLMPRGEGIESLETLQLKRYPEGFNKAESMQLIMQMFALSYGFETRTFWPASQTGATKADAELSHLKEKSKFLAWFIDRFTTELNEKFAPDGVTFAVDYVDDEQDLRSAEVTEKRIGYLATALNSGLLNKQTAWELMVENDIISVEQFERMMVELEENRQQMQEQLNQPPTTENESEPDEEQENGLKKKAIADAEFEAELDVLIEAANDGDITEDEFNAEMESLILAAALEAWREGSGLDEPDAEQRAEIDARLADSLPYVREFGAAVVAAEVATSLLRNNAPMWRADILAIFELGKLHNPDYEYLQWNVSANKEHCTDCARLNGQVHTKEEWLNSGWRPQSRRLACTGRRCGCSLTSTDGPSRGSF